MFSKKSLPSLHSPAFSSIQFCCSLTMKVFNFLTAAAAAAAMTSSSASALADIPIPNARQLEFMEQETIQFMHFGTFLWLVPGVLPKKQSQACCKGKRCCFVCVVRTMVRNGCALCVCVCVCAKFPPQASTRSGTRRETSCMDPTRRACGHARSPSHCNSTECGQTPHLSLIHI